MTKAYVGQKYSDYYLSTFRSQEACLQTLLNGGNEMEVEMEQTTPMLHFLFDSFWVTNKHKIAINSFQEWQ